LAFSNEFPSGILDGSNIPESQKNFLNFSIFLPISQIYQYFMTKCRTLNRLKQEFTGDKRRPDAEF
jgi:hypothetical protein